MRRHIARAGGADILLLKFLRLGATLALKVLVTYTSARNGWHSFDIALLATLVSFLEVRVSDML